MTAILQHRLPFLPWMHAAAMRLPGTRPATPGDWVRVDEAYGAQMALRDAILTDRRDQVLACLPEARGAAAELLDAGLARLATEPGFRVARDRVTRPDGEEVPLRGEDPLGTLGRLVQEDLCLLQKRPDDAEHRLTGAVLCFPAGWTLAEKIGRPMTRVHRPVPGYAPAARRAQRLFDGVRPGRPVCRNNAHPHHSPDLFTPRTEADPMTPEPRGRFIRSEFQTLSRLPRTGAVLFSIHTYMVRRDSLSGEEEAALIARPGT